MYILNIKIISKFDMNSNLLEFENTVDLIVLIRQNIINMKSKPIEMNGCINEVTNDCLKNKPNKGFKAIKTH